MPKEQTETQFIDEVEQLRVKHAPPNIPPRRGTSSQPKANLIPANDPPTINTPPPEPAAGLPEAPKSPALDAPKAPTLEAPKVPALEPPNRPLPSVAEGEGLKLPEVATPKIPEVPLVEPVVPRPGVGGALGRGAAEMGVRALEGALGLALLVADLIIQLIIVPKLLEFQRKLEESRRKSLQKQIQDYFDKFQSQGLLRKLRTCFLWDLQQFEAAGKTGYVNATLLVRLSDTSNRFQPFHEKPPESLFDFEFEDAVVSSVRLSDNPIEAKAGAMTRCDNCGTMGRGKTFILNNPIWEQPISFSFAAPTSQQLLKEFPLEPGEDVKKQSCCFIATACFGTAVAPQVVTLREFRDRKLMPHRAGRAFVRFYYANSPRLAAWLERNAFARALTRETLVRPAAAIIRWSASP